MSSSNENARQMVDEPAFGQAMILEIVDVLGKTLRR
jgi:hypothetical protein